MNKWDYVTLHITYDKKKHKNWIVGYNSGKTLVGLSTILETYGAQGWELVTLIPDHLEAYPGFGQWNIAPQTYRATFKRPMAES